MTTRAETPPWLTISLLLAGSGFCALVYQTVWFREFRLVFGCSTAATAVVTAVFMGGLGFGGLFFGQRADASDSPLKLYAGLELGVVLLAGLSPHLLDLSRSSYIQVCLAFAPGFHAKTLLRLLLAILIMGPPAFLMGGTFPAAVRAALRPTDIHRGPVAILYGANTIGAVLGIFSATFFFFEWWGFRFTMGAAVILNFLVVLAAYRWASSGSSPGSPQDESATPSPTVVQDAPPSSPALIYFSAFLSGFCFFLLEMVWFRMLGPLMGGTTYSYGIILVIALLGIGVGGLLYQLCLLSSRPSPFSFACSCGILSVFAAGTFALGDIPAILTLFMKYFAVMGFWGLLFSWNVIGFLVVFPVALVAGYQFPLLISLLGKGNQEVGRHIGRTYAWNTAGSILGSLAGGLVLLPFLTAPGCWQLAAVCLIGLGVIWCISFWRTSGPRIAWVIPLGLAVFAGFLVTQPGPTTFSRHSTIGYGVISVPNSWNQLQEIMYQTCRSVREEFEGSESVVGLEGSDGWNFLVNGKSDGNVIRDGEMQIMAGLVSAVFHPEPRRAFVVGLGTGCTSGALARIDTMEAVTTAEIEPRIIEVARRCAPVNFDVLNNPKARTVLDDAREVLLCATETYDLIVSEPSNPHRAGVSSLFTQEFYRVVANRLASDGIFTQWVQSYSINAKTFAGIYATLFTVFPHIETWETRNGGDVLLLCSRRPILWDAATIRRRISQEPFRSSLASTWKSYTLEGFVAKFAMDSAGGRRLAQVAEREGHINRDDWLPVEYGFARCVGFLDRTLIDLRHAAQILGSVVPPLATGTYDPHQLAESRSLLYSLYGSTHPVTSQTPPDVALSIAAQDLWANRQFAAALERWRKRSAAPTHPIEMIMLAEAMAQVGNKDAIGILARLPPDRAAEGHLILARLAYQRGDWLHSCTELQKAFVIHRTNPWVLKSLMLRGLDLALLLAEKDKGLAAGIGEALDQPFCQNALQENRLLTLIYLSRHLPPAVMYRHLQALEPYPVWDEGFLSIRNACYRTMSSPLEGRAFSDLERYYDNFFPSLSRYFLINQPEP
jgi:predicted membrane-bound spermidine synthase